jgi:hypothetical protein
LAGHQETLRDSGSVQYKVFLFLLHLLRNAPFNIQQIHHLYITNLVIGVFKKI